MTGVGGVGGKQKYISCKEELLKIIVQSRNEEKNWLLGSHFKLHKLHLAATLYLAACNFIGVQLIYLAVT